MPLDAAPPAQGARPVAPHFRDDANFHPYTPPSHIDFWSDDDEASLVCLELAWAHLRGPIAPEDDDTTDRWDDDDNYTPQPTSTRCGLRVAECADALTIPQAAFVALCEHRGILALRRRGRQQRRFITPSAKRDGLGWNVRPHRAKVAHQEPFPVFHPLCLDHLDRILGWSDLLDAVAMLPPREEQRGYLLTHHAYLPDAIIGVLSGYARSAVQKARRGKGR